MAEPKPSLTQRKNIRDVTSEIDALHAQHYKDESARMVKDYMQHFTKGVEKLCADDMSKEAFVDATPNRTITLVVLSPQ
ncbi:hypothetical protein QOT17_018361 [Balamuthia mandrillaris]